MPPFGIVSYGSYLPYWRLSRSALAAAWSGGGKGFRSVASFDEDTTTMAVAAAQATMASAPAGLNPDRLYLATAAPAYAERTNAATVNAALGLPPSTAAYDFGAAIRSGVGVVRAALDAADSGHLALVVMSDIRTGLPSGGDESTGGDGAAAMLMGSGDEVIAEAIGWASVTMEFIDRWRLPGQASSHGWEERFGEQLYGASAEAGASEALKSAGLTPAEVDCLIVTGPHVRGTQRIASRLGVPPEAMWTDSVTSTIGNTGTAQGGLALASVLDQAEPGQTILLVSLADGADAVVWRTTDALVKYRHRGSTTLASQLSAETSEVQYPTFLSWRGMIDREPPRRPDPDRPSAPASARREGWKFGLFASRCTACGTRHLPPQRICLRCHAQDEMVPERMADTCGTIRTLTIDRLSFSPSPPLVAAVVDFDGGGRLQCELTDVDPLTVQPGDRVTMTFRRLFTAGDVHNYFWKARPVQKGRC
jgi:hydroxymethylglutaryl-CoA synthase